MSAKRLPSSLRADEPERLLASLRCPRDRLLVGLALGDGLRVGELVCLRLEDIDLAGASCMVQHGKGDKARMLPVAAKLLSELRSWIGDRREGWLFPSPRTTSGHLSIRAVQVLVKKAAARAGIARRVSPHKCRHTFAQKLLATGADIMVVKDLMGHASIATTQVYIFADPDRARAAVERLEGEPMAAPPKGAGAAPDAAALVFVIDC